MRKIATEKNYFDIRNVTENSAEIYIYTSILRWGEEYGYKSATDVQKELKALENIKQLNVYINSPGGSVFEGMSIMSMLSRLRCKKTVYIDGLCASIATVIAFGIGAEVHMASTALVMIHNAINSVDGNYKDFEKAANDLKKIDSSLVSVYLQKTNGSLSEQEIRDFMDAETWFSAAECSSYGFIDYIDAAGTQQACLPKDYYNHYKNVPSSVLVDDGTPKQDASGNAAGTSSDEQGKLKQREMTAEEKAVLESAEKVLAEYEKRKDDVYARYQYS